MKFQKHILILSPGFPKDENDFNCIPPLQEFLIKFKLQHPLTKISVVAFQYPYYRKTYDWNKISIVPLGGKNLKLKKPFIWLKAIRGAKKIHRSNPVDVVHSLWVGECAMIGNILSKSFNCDHICTLMGQDVKASNKYLKRIKNSNVKFIALSKNQAQDFLKLTDRKVDGIIHWGIEDQQISSQEREIDLLGVGSLIPLKNYSLFIKVIAEIVKANPELKCKLVGTGPESSKLITMAESMGIINNVDFTGLLDRKEIFKLMQRSKILIHPSKFEGFGFVFAEALVNGMQIVSFNVGYVQNHPKWSIAKDELEFIQLTKNLLHKSLDFNPVNLFQLKETVERYASIYGI